MNITDKKICVTGGNGFFGRHIVSELQRRGCTKVLIPRSQVYDLRTPEGVRAMYYTLKPEIVIHAAALCGGIGLNMEIPGLLFYENAMMGMLMLEEGRKCKIEKFVQIGTCCSYPKFTPIPFQEKDLWNGYPEETNAPYGIAKKALLTMGQAYRAQYGFNAIHLLVVNLYGPGDHSSLKHAHVIPSLIRKFIEAKENDQSTVTVWGTGQSSREFFYVEDAAKDFVTATEKYSSPEPLNLGNGVETTIREIAERIAQRVGFTGGLVFDTSITDGQPHRCMSIEKARAQFELCPKTDLTTGIDKTVEWYYKSIYRSSEEK
jgi:GDP-L-fucose synthase